MAYLLGGFLVALIMLQYTVYWADAWRNVIDWEAGIVVLPGVLYGCIACVIRLIERRRSRVRRQRWPWIVAGLLVAYGSSVLLIVVMTYGT